MCHLLVRAAMTRRNQYFTPEDDDEGGSDYKELESPVIEAGTLAIRPDQTAAVPCNYRLQPNPYTETISF